MGNKEIMEREFNQRIKSQTGTYKNYKNTLVKINVLMRKVFDLLPMECGKCTSCCCHNCGIHAGHFVHHEIILFQKEIKETLKKKGSDKWNGFCDPQKGCMLPIEARSATCVFYLEHYCVPVKYEGVVATIKTIKSVISNSNPDNYWRTDYNMFPVINLLISHIKLLNKTKSGVEI